MHLLKSTKIVIAAVALVLTAATVAFAVGASQGQPTLVVHEASDRVGRPAPEPSDRPDTTRRPTPERTTFTTSYPEARRASEKTTPRHARTPAVPRRTKPASKPTATSRPTATPSSTAPAASPSPSTDPVTALVTSLLGG